MVHSKLISFMVFCLLILTKISIVSSSAGDSSTYYKNCCRSCGVDECINDGLNFKRKQKETLINHVVQWKCADECKYECMWKTVEAFHGRGWPTPQFHGKWPFVRWLGMQEPASVLFSIFNLLVHIWGLYNLRKYVSKTTDFYYMWHTFSIICINAWVCSSIFHTRDTDLTELFDYSAAYSMVISSFYCMIARSCLHRRNFWLKAGLAFMLGCFFYRHFVFLVFFQGYSYNMKVNIATGTAAGVGWLIWVFRQHKKRPYVLSLAWFVVLSALALVLEVTDFSPFLYIIDAHSLWHLVTAPITILLYKFILDDCHALADEGEKEKIP